MHQELFEKELEQNLVDSSTATKKIRTTKRIKLAIKQNWACCWCGQSMTAPLGYFNTVTVEHLHPKSLGGKNHLHNLSAACWRCNNLRGVEDADTFGKMAAALPSDTRFVQTVLDDLALARVAKHKLMQQEHSLAASAAKESKKRDKQLAREAVELNLPNPFEKGTRPFHLYCEYSAKRRVMNPPKTPLWIRLINIVAPWLAPRLAMMTNSRPVKK